MDAVHDSHHQPNNNRHRPRMRGSKRSLNYDARKAIPLYFESRIDCSLFGNVVQLQFDFTIPSQHQLVYYVNQSLHDSYWETLRVLFQIESLRSVDIVFPDPHLLLVAHILQQSDRYDKSTKRFQFSLFPKKGFVCFAKALRSLRFAVKTHSYSELDRMLDVHFEHYYHPSQHRQKYKNHSTAMNRPEYAQYVNAQRQQSQFKRLDIYNLSRKVCDSLNPF